MIPLREGVEEKKEDYEHAYYNPVSPRRSQSQENDEEERKHGFQAQVEKFAKMLFSSCDAASVFTAQTCSPQWHPSAENAASPPPPPPLSIADELRKLAAQEGGDFPYAGPRAADIPKFLGEEAVRSFEDDNISAISQNTLEEMARNGVVHPASHRMMLNHRQHQQRLLQRQQQNSSSPNSQTGLQSQRKSGAVKTDT